MRKRVAAVVGVALLAGCGELPDRQEAAGSTSTVAAPATDSARRLADHVAFAFSLSFRAPGDLIDDVQRAQEDACEALGPAHCMVLGSTLEGRDGRFARGTLTVLAAPQDARGLTRRFDAIATQNKGSLTASEMTGEALDEAVATAADARAGSERGVGDAESTLAQGRGTLNRLDAGREVDARRTAANEAAAAQRALTGRLAVSRISVAYESDLPVALDRGRPLAEAWAEAGRDLSESLAVIFKLLVVVGPFALAGGAALWTWRRFDRRSRALPA